jgi:hypothetical protein
MQSHSGDSYQLRQASCRVWPLPRLVFALTSDPLRRKKLKLGLIQQRAPFKWSLQPNAFGTKYCSTPHSTRRARNLGCVFSLGCQDLTAQLPRSYITKVLRSAVRDFLVFRREVLRGRNEWHPVGVRPSCPSACTCARSREGPRPSSPSHRWRENRQLRHANRLAPDREHVRSRRRSPIGSLGHPCYAFRQRLP